MVPSVLVDQRIENRRTDVAADDRAADEQHVDVLLGGEQPFERLQTDHGAGLVEVGANRQRVADRRDPQRALERHQEDDDGAAGQQPAAQPPVTLRRGAVRTGSR